MKRRSSRTFLALCALFALGLVAAILGLPRAANGRILATSTTPTGPPITTTNRSGATEGNQAAAGKGVWMAFEIQPASLALKPLRRFAACARRHGLAKTPDPKTVGGKVVLMLPHGYLRKNPRIKSAERSCKRFIPAGAPFQVRGRRQRARPERSKAQRRRSPKASSRCGSGPRRRPLPNAKRSPRVKRENRERPPCSPAMPSR